MWPNLASGALGDTLFSRQPSPLPRIGMKTQESDGYVNRKQFIRLHRPNLPCARIGHSMRSCLWTLLGSLSDRAHTSSQRPRRFPDSGDSQRPWYFVAERAFGITVSSAGWTIAQTAAA